MRRSIRFTTVLLASAAILLLALLMLAHPSAGVKAAVRGIAIWWDVLFPALFPFLVLSELMLGFGIVHFFGTLLDPLMRPVFRVPGIGGFVMAMGFASGYPVAARLTSQLWDQRLINREEGERLVAFATTSDPIFLIGAVSVGFFQDVGLAAILAVAHYGTAVAVGLIMRFYGGRAPAAAPVVTAGRSLLLRSFQAMHEARLRDGRPFGSMLQQAIRSSIQMVFVIGGLVVFFSVVMDMLTLTGIMEQGYRAVHSLLSLLGVPSDLSEAVLNGFFEVTLGAKAAGAASVPLIYKTAVGAFVLSWAGLSVHAQIVSLLHRTDLRYTPFFLARIIHGVLSAAVVLLLWDFLEPLRGVQAEGVLDAFADAGPAYASWHWSLPVSVGAAVAGMAFLLGLTSLRFFYIKMNEWYAKIRK